MQSGGHQGGRLAGLQLRVRVHDLLDDRGNLQAALAADGVVLRGAGCLEARHAIAQAHEFTVLYLHDGRFVGDALLAAVAGSPHGRTSLGTVVGASQVRRKVSELT